MGAITYPCPNLSSDFLVKGGQVAIILMQLLNRLILGLRPANERRRYFVTTTLIGWAQA